MHSPKCDIATSRTATTPSCSRRSVRRIVSGPGVLAAIRGFARILTAISERCGLDLPYEPGEVRLDSDRLIGRLRLGQL